jgi:membrane protease YdiL (CAAX protease family)
VGDGPGGSPEIVTFPGESAITFRLGTSAATSDPLPVIVNDRFLALTAAQVGDVVTASTLGQPLSLRIVGSTALFPPLDPGTAFALVDAHSLEIGAFSSLGRTLTADEWWVSIDAGAVGRGSEFPEFSRTVYAIANFVCYGLGEEVGWRGFALPRLQASRSALRASLLLAIGWAGWHLPLFAFSPGMASMGPAGALGWFASLCVGSILLTWLFNSSGGSIGVVALFHGALDIFMMSPVAPGLTNVMGALLTVGTLLLIPVFGHQNLARRPRVTSSADFAPAQDPGGVT